MSRAAPDTSRGTVGLGLASLLAALMPLLAGCPAMNELPHERPVQEFTVRDTAERYYAYVPSRYSDRRAWPLIVLCHGGKPYDSAWMEMREWARFAETHDFLIAAPELTGTGTDLRRDSGRQMEKLRHDERTILGAVAAMKAAHRIAEDQVFLCGWGGGANAVWYAGLKNPDVFRALAVRQGGLEPALVNEISPLMDRAQRMLLYYSFGDISHDSAVAAAAWLRERGMFVDTHQEAGVAVRLPIGVIWDYFKDIYRNTPWIRVQAVIADPHRPRRVQFAVRTVPALVGARWEFGDGQSADGAQAEHEYAQDGTYDVAVRVRLVKGKGFRRALQVRVPRPGVGVAESE